ncbi:unnamed protein product, partial [Gongylonema pulchrum]|uniref:FSA_C domain-containing protein n=1 Tax=Gongylonema pulchrum TaxID=637853 RepID=A0A183ENB2_9BILA
MIGIDQLFDWTNMTPQMTLPSGFHVIPTTLGNIIAGSGQLGHNAVKKTTCTAAVLLSEEDSMQQFWSLEGIGITDMDNKEDDEVAYQLFKNTITRNAEGIDWDRREDLIVLRTPVLPMAGATKRAILSVIASIYDPCGWMSPITVPIKHFLQELWASRTDWDQTLNEEQER